MLLSELKVGRSAVIITVNGKGATRRRLLDLGIIPRTKVQVVKTAPLGDPIEISVRGFELTIRRKDAENIEILEETI